LQEKGCAQQAVAADRAIARANRRIHALCGLLVSEGDFHALARRLNRVPLCRQQVKGVGHISFFFMSWSAGAARHWGVILSQRGSRYSPLATGVASLAE
jgi:hypothetical protein